MSSFKKHIKASKRKEKIIKEAIDWHRILTDEAYVINVINTFGILKSIRCNRKR